jgi:hypothetical protein
MPRKPTPPEPWWPDAADLMASCNLSLRQAAAELGIDLTIEEAEAVKDRKLFQRALEDAKIAYYESIGSNVRLSKDVVVGQVYSLAGKLAEQGEAYKASDALLKLAKIKGWVGYEPDTLYKIFKSLTHKEIQEIRQNITDRAAAESEPGAAEPHPEDGEPLN